MEWIRYVTFLVDEDPGFRFWWSRLTPHQREQKTRALQQLGELGETMPFDQDGAVDRGFRRFVEEILRRRFAGLPNTAFALEPDAQSWIESIRLRWRLAGAYYTARSRICRRLTEIRGDWTTIYGGIKSPEAIRRKVHAYEANRRPLDLWDCVRLRIVCPRLNGLSAVARVLLDEYGSDVVRCRNYFTHPRSDTDAYRAIHLNLRQDACFVEVQIVTCAREVVCQVDHALVFKGTLLPLHPSHAPALRSLSVAANVRDAAESILFEESWKTSARPLRALILEESFNRRQ